MPMPSTLPPRSPSPPPSPGSRRAGRCPPGLGLALLLALAGCSKHTYLVVDFKSDGNVPPIYGIRVALTLSPPSGATRQSVDTLPSATNTAVIGLPTSAAFRLDDAAGTLDIGADGLNQKRESVAKGSVHTTVAHAQTWTVTLTLTAQQALSAAPLEPAPGRPLDDELDLERRAQDPSWLPSAPR